MRYHQACARVRMPSPIAPASISLPALSPDALYGKVNRCGVSVVGPRPLQQGAGTPGADHGFGYRSEDAVITSQSFKDVPKTVIAQVSAGGYRLRATSTDNRTPVASSV